MINNIKYKALIILVILTSCIASNAQNVGISSIQFTPLMRLDIRGDNTAATTANQNLFQIASTDVTPFALRFGLQTHATATSRYAFIEVDDNGTKRDLSILPSGGNVGIGTTIPSDNLHLNYSSLSATNQGLKIQNTAATAADYFRMSIGYPGYYDGWALFHYNSDLMGYLNSGGLGSFRNLYVEDNYYIRPTQHGNSYLRFVSATNNTVLQGWNDLLLQTSAMPDAFILKSDGNVGIGTTIPSAKLDILGTASQIQFRVTSLSGQGPYPVIFQEGGSTSAINIPSNMSSIEHTGNTDFNISNLTAGYSLLLSTNGTERARINSDGNVGIGTTSPSYLLSLGGTSARTFGMDRNTTAATTGQGFTLDAGGATSGGTDLAGGDLTIQSGISTGAGTSAIRLFTSPGIAGATVDNTRLERVTVLGNGNVGIGSNVPTQALEVNGVMKITAGSTGFLTFQDGTTLATAPNTLANVWSVAGADIYNNNAGNVGINSSTPSAQLDVRATNTTGNSINLTSNSLTSGTGINVASSATALVGSLSSIALSGNNVANTGNLLNLNSSGANSVAKALNVTVASTGNLSTTGGVRFNFSGNHTGSGFRIDDITTAGTTVDIVNNALAGGTGLSITSTAAGNNFTGKLVDVSLTGSNAGNTGTLFRASNTGVASAVTVGMISNGGTGTSFRVNDDGTDTDTSPFLIDAAGNVGIANTAPGALLDLGLAGSRLGVLRLAGSTSGNVTIQPAATAGTWSLTLPTTAGTNKQFLQTNGSGVSTWSPLVGTAVVATSETRNTNTFGALATAGPAVTINTGTTAIVTLTAKMSNSNNGRQCQMGFAVSGASTIAASTSQCLWMTSSGGGDPIQMSATFVVTGLTAGNNTFTAVYSAPTNTCTYENRNLVVMPY